MGQYFYNPNDPFEKINDDSYEGSDIFAAWTWIFVEEDCRVNGVEVPYHLKRCWGLFDDEHPDVRHAKENVLTDEEVQITLADQMARERFRGWGRYG